MPSLQELVLGRGSEISARSPHPLRTCSLSYSPVTFIADTLGGRDRFRLKGIARNAVIFFVPSARAGLGLAVAGEREHFHVGPSGRSDVLRESASRTHVQDDDNWEIFFNFPPALGRSFATPAIYRLGRIPNIPDRLPHLRYLHLDCEVERSPGDGSESPHIALRQLLRHRARIENPMDNAKSYAAQCRQSRVRLSASRACRRSLSSV